MPNLQFSRRLNYTHRSFSSGCSAHRGGCRHLLNRRLHQYSQEYNRFGHYYLLTDHWRQLVLELGFTCEYHRSSRKRIETCIERGYRVWAWHSQWQSRKYEHSEFQAWYPLRRMLSWSAVVWATKGRLTIHILESVFVVAGISPWQVRGDGDGTEDDETELKVSTRSQSTRWCCRRRITYLSKESPDRWTEMLRVSPTPRNTHALTYLGGIGKLNIPTSIITKIPILSYISVPLLHEVISAWKRISYESGKG